MGTIQTAMATMGYRRVTPARICQNCDHAKPETTGLYCKKGAFFVLRTAGCDEYSPAPRVAELKP